MTLTQWAEKWPYRVTYIGRSEAITPDILRGDNSYRTLAWSLEDYRVSSVTGGSIWFMKRQS